MANKAGATRRKQLIPKRLKKQTPEELRLAAIEAEAQGKRDELAAIKRQQDNMRRSLQKKEAAARRLAEHIANEHISTVKHNVFTEQELEDALPVSVKEDVLQDDVNIVFRPNPGPQTDFLAANEKEVFFGGSRGGGKSFSLLVDPLRYCPFENHSALILRRTMPELRDLITHSHRLYDKAFPGAKWKEQDKVWTFPSGARIEFGYAENELDALRYQGKAYTGIYVDELPQYPTSDVWTLLKGSLRSVDTRIPTYMRASGNPGNLGSMWVKQMFIDPAVPGEAFYVPVDPNNSDGEKISRRFIRSTLDDNPYLTQTVDYRNMLLSLPEVKRRQWLDGDWSAFEGAVFSEFDQDIHVIKPFEIPSNWPKFRSCDWGFASPFCVLWFAVDYDNVLYVYREFYGNKLTADIFARKVKQIEENDHILYGIMDSSAWAKRGDIGPPVPEIMRQNGCSWRPSDRSRGSRVSGWMEIHRRLRIIEDENGRPTAKLKIFNTCRNLIRTLPLLPADDNNPEDINTKAEDHAADALRYGAMSRPLDPTKFEYYQQMDRREKWLPANRVIGY